MEESPRERSRGFNFKGWPNPSEATRRDSKLGKKRGKLVEWILILCTQSFSNEKQTINESALYKFYYSDANRKRSDNNVRFNCL